MSSYFIIKDLYDLIIGSLFMLLLIMAAHRFDFLAKIFKITYLLFWGCATPGIFIYQAFFHHTDFIPAAVTLILGFLLSIPWFLIALPQILHEFNL